jgi:hypothetical protein
MQHHKKPLAGMVICRSGPNLTRELKGSENSTGFPDPNHFDHFAHSGRRLLTLPSPEMAGTADYENHAAAANAGSR